MKKIIFSIVGSVLISLCAVQAQQPNDTTGTASKTKQQNKQKYEKSRQQTDRTRNQKNDQSWQQQSDRAQYPDGYANEGMVIIDKSEMPPALKQTLQKEQYAGWENATIYHNTNTGEYVIAPRAYRFDKQGKEIEMKNSPAYGSREGRQGRYSSGDLNSQDPARTRESQSRTQSQDQSYQEQSREQNAQQDQSAQSQSQSQTDQADNAQSSQPSDNSDQAQQSQSPQRDQQPSSSYRNDRSNQSDANTQTQPGQSSQNQYNTENMTEIQAEQVPASLRRTLSESQYKGWEEKGTLYQDPATSDYVLEMESTTDASQPRTYRFDKNGQLKPGQNGTGNSDQ